MQHTQWLSDLEQTDRDTDLESVVLWPGSVRDEMQTTITQMYGVSDLSDAEDSRPRQIIAALAGLNLPEHFSVLDICCGDGLVLWRIKQAFPAADTYGIDINKGHPDTHDLVQHDGVRLYRVSIQRLFEHAPAEPFDVVLMLNTYRGWSAAQLRDCERSLPAVADKWLASHSRHAIVTMNPAQIGEWEHRREFAVIGKGEQDSQMALLSWTI